MGESNNPLRIPRQDIISTVRGIVPLQRGYIADKVLPPLSVYQTSGTRPVQLYDNSTALLLGRSPGTLVDGSNPGNGGTNSYNRTADLYSFTTSEILSRQVIDVNQSPMFGGIEGQELALGVSGLVNTLGAIENTVVQAVGNATSTTVGNGVTLVNGTSDPYNNVRQAVVNLLGFGNVALAGSYVAFDKLRQNATVIDRMKNTGIVLTDKHDAREVSSAQLAAIFGASEVHEAYGPASTTWLNGNASGYYIVAYVEADPMLDPMSYPQVGRRFVYTWAADGVNEDLIVEQGYHIGYRADVLDFVTFSQASVFQTKQSWATLVQVA